MLTTLTTTSPHVTAPGDDPLHPTPDHEDADRYYELEQAGFAGPVWHKLTDELLAYAWNALHGLVHSGAISSVQTGTPHPTLPAAHVAILRDSRDLRDDMIIDGLLWAIPKFREHLQEGRWDPVGGAALKSYFVGTAAAGFWVFYKKWVDEHDRAARRDQHMLAELLAQAPSTDPGDAIVFRDLVREILRAANERQRAVILGVLQGKSYSEIAHDLQTTTRAVEALMYRLRGRVKHLAEERRS